jgi:hypothetical protein
MHLPQSPAEGMFVSVHSRCHATQGIEPPQRLGGMRRGGVVHGCLGCSDGSVGPESDADHYTWELFVWEHVVNRKHGTVDWNKRCGHVTHVSSTSAVAQVKNRCIRRVNILAHLEGEHLLL